jgi:hypothetical protein
MVESLPAADNPFVGKWIANFPKSKVPPDFQYKCVTLQIAIVFDTVTLGSKSVTASGQEHSATELFLPTARNTWHAQPPAFSTRHRWVNARMIETRATKDGKEMGVMTYEVSADGRPCFQILNFTPTNGCV